MSYKGTDKCIEKAFDDEMLFVLMARDETAPAVIMEWIKLNVGKQPPEKLREAFDCAIEMQRTRNVFQVRKNPIMMKLDISLSPYDIADFPITLYQLVEDETAGRAWKALITKTPVPQKYIAIGPLSVPTQFKLIVHCSPPELTEVENEFIVNPYDSSTIRVR